MSGTQPSAFGNVLFNPMVAIQQTEGEQNVLMNQQKIAQDNATQVGQAASYIANLPPEQRQSAYETLIPQLQAQGYAKGAPASYPGDNVINAYARIGVPVAQQYQYGMVVSPELRGALAGAGAPLPGEPGYGAAAPGGGATGGTGGGGGTDIYSLPKDQFLSAVARRESGGDPTALNYVARADPSAYDRGATASGKYQMVNSTWLTAAKAAGIDTTQYPTARSAPEALQDQAASKLYDMQGTAPWNPSKWTKNWVQGSGGKYTLAEAPYQPPSGGNPPAAAAAQPSIASATLPAQGTPQGGPTVASATLPPQGPAPGRGGVPAGTPPTQVAGPGGPGAAPTIASATQPPTGPPAIASATQPPTPGLAAGLNPLYNPNAQPNRPPVAPNAVAPQAPPPPGPVAPAPAAPAPAAPAAPAPGSAAPNAPPSQLPPSGVNSVQYQQASELLRRAQAIEAAGGAMTPQGKAVVDNLRQRAQLLLQTDSVVQLPDGRQFHPLTGKIDDPAKPLPHYVYDADQHAYIDTTGTNKPEFEPAQRDSAVAQRTVMELGPKVANGTATPQEQANYATAVETYRQPVLKENPVTKETVRVNTRELPAGFPEPPGIGGSGAPGGGGSGPQVVIPGYSPQQQEIERDPAKAKVADEQYGRDSRNVSDLSAGVTTAQNDNLRTKEMLDLLNNGDFSTGPGSETRTRAIAWFQRWAPASLSGWESQSANLSGAAAAQAFQKLAFQGVTTQEKESSPRGGILATQLFQRNNPGLDLLNPTNVSLLDMKLIQNQANIDYGRDALGHFAAQETRYGDTHKYSSLEQFNTQWVNQRNPQVYAAAMGAIAGQDPAQWAKGLSDAEYARALGIVERAKPGAIVNGKSGRIVVSPPAPTPPPGFTVVQ